MTTTTLFRPTEQKELALVADSGFSSWPQPVPGQPKFFPVTSEDYAAQIAQRWNIGEDGSGKVGYVTKFKVESDYLSQFDVEHTGGQQHTEYSIPNRFSKLNGDRFF